MGQGSGEGKLSGHYCIRADYVARSRPDYDDRHVGEPGGVEDTDGRIWQPDVYADARSIAQASRAARLIDIGCGTGAKVLASARGRPTIGLDFGANVEKITLDRPDCAWRSYDIDSGTAAPIADHEFDGAVVVCADVLEHVIHPEYLMREFRRALDRGATAVVMSTPDRERSHMGDYFGPPNNPNHVREWTLEEFVAFLGESGIANAVVRNTRAHDVTAKCGTTEAILTSTSGRLGWLRIGPGIRVTRPGVPVWRRIHGEARRIWRGGKRRLGKLIRNLTSRSAIGTPGRPK